jgi:hypothetical protein
MDEKKAIGLTLFACGVAFVNGVYSPLECHSAELCRPLVADLPHGSHPERYPFEPVRFKVLAAQSSTSSISGGMGWMVPPTTK